MRGYGQVNAWHEKAQLTIPTSHCAILSASPMLQLPSLFTSHFSGWLNGATPHVRSSTSYWAMTSASPMLIA